MEETGGRRWVSQRRCSGAAGCYCRDDGTREPFSQSRLILLGRDNPTALRSEPHTKLQAKRRVAQGYDALVATPGELQWQFEEVVRAIIGTVAGNRTHPQHWD